MKFMKKSAKKFCLKLAASILSTTIVASIALPMNVLATTVDTTTEILSENTTINSSSPDYSDNIIREVEEERDEFSKTFLMTDGTYYTYVSPVAIHKFIEDKWVDIDDSLSETPATILEAEDMVKEYIEDSEILSRQISTLALEEQTPAINVTCIGAACETNSGFSLPYNGAIVIKPSYITKLSMLNKVLLSATLTISIESNMFNSSAALYLKTLTSEVTNTTSLDDITNSPDTYTRVYDSESTDYSFDITNDYSKWERGNLSNYGVALIAPDLEIFPLNITAQPIISFRYKDVASNDSSFTYHTLDLGKAGILSINDVTNAFKLEQNIAGLDCSILPVSLTRTIDSANFTLDSYANVSSEWNYGYSLVVIDTTAIVTLPEGTKLEFEKPSDVDSDITYQTWEQPEDSKTYVAGATLHLKSGVANSGGVGANYKDCYLDINGIEYWFNSLGRIKHIQKADKILNVSYEFSNDADSFVINKLVDADGNQYYITYSLYEVNNSYYIYASKIEVKDYNNNPIQFDNVPLEINISNTVSGSNIISSYSYPNGTDEPQTISYYYDLNGKLLGILNADGTTTELHYKSNDNHYLTGYTQTKNGTIINEFTISSENTYERKFRGTFLEDEIQRYDSDFQLITYYYGDNIVSMSYDNGIIDSYAVNNSSYENVHNELINGDFSTNPVSNGWKKYKTVTPDYDPVKQCVVIENESINDQVGLKQTISNLKPNTTYVFSAETIIENSIPSVDYEFTVKIDFFTNPNNIEKTIYLPFDVSLLNDKQIRMCAFKTEQTYYATISFFTNGNIGKFEVDNMYLYEAAEEDGSVAIPTVSTSDPIVETTENGTLIRETISNGNMQMYQEYEYSLDGTKLLANTDFNGVSTYFDYSGRTGKLNKKGYELVDDEVINPISYSYNSSGLLKSVQQIVKSVSGESNIYLAQYSYDSINRVTSVTNNKHTYTISYDNVGNVSNIKKAPTNTVVTDINTLVDYTYSDNCIGTIEYSNGYTINYYYNSNNDIEKIDCIKLVDETPTIVTSYLYTYTNGKISEVLITACDLSYNIKIKYSTDETIIYHEQNGVELEVYRKKKTASNTEEKYISSVTGSNVLESYTTTNVTETVVGDNTELYSEFYGSKHSSITSTSPRLDFSGSNNTVKDYFGRVSSKYFTLESEIYDIETQNKTQEHSLSLTHNYTYATLSEKDGKITTSNLISSASNTVSATSTKNNILSTEAYDITYYYIYDQRGNIKLVYFQAPEDDTYYFESFYQYDEANQITSSICSDEVTCYLYDNNGNILEKQLGGEVTFSGYPTNLNFDLFAIPAGNWDAFLNENLNNIKFVSSKPERKVIYTYDAQGRLSNYKDEVYTYDNQGNVIGNLTEIIIDENITYDTYGNPLKYIGESTTYDETIVATLEWSGKQLSTAIIYTGGTAQQKLSFIYDENGYRINKTSYDCSVGEDNKLVFTETVATDYIWDNGKLTGMQLSYIDEGQREYMYTNIVYDNTGIPYAITTPTGLAYYFLRDASNNVRGLIGSDGELATYMNYDAFGNFTIESASSNIGTAIINMLSAMYNPCTYKGYLYDYELGMYFIQDKCYSPLLGRFINETNLETLLEPKDNPLNTNLAIFCNNNPVNGSDVNAEWGREKYTFNGEQTYGVQVEMSKAFLSRPFCTLFASKILSDSGSWDYLHGRSYKNMDVERIASNLFARCVGNYAESAINKVNATWGDGWIVSNRNSKVIKIVEDDPNADKYIKIWSAAPSIKAFAIANGIYITL